MDICGEWHNALGITGSISNKAERDDGVDIQATETHQKNLKKRIPTCLGLSWVLPTK